jgi:pimeloyl-ACP methyl ester carboxylesterase
MRRAVLILSVVAAFLVAAFVALRTPDSDPAAMKARYTNQASAFTSTDGGLSVHYRDEGCRGCPVLLLVHGSNASLHTFEPLIARLGSRYRLISYDHPGHGLTGPHPRDDYSVRGYFEALEAVLAATGVSSFSLAGNSMGGWVAWRYALAHPEKVNALILLDASGAPPPADAEKSRPYLGARIMRHPIGRRLGQHVTPRSLVEKSLQGATADPAFVTDVMTDRYWELLRYPGNRRAAGLRAVAERDAHYGERLGEIEAPTLILWGAQDSVTPLFLADSFDTRIPDSRKVVFEGVGHLPMEEAPDRTAASIEAFLSEVRDGG